jgi:hypothetical protein
MIKVAEFDRGLGDFFCGGRANLGRVGPFRRRRHAKNDHGSCVGQETAPVHLGRPIIRVASRVCRGRLRLHGNAIPWAGRDGADENLLGIAEELTQEQLLL